MQRAELATLLVETGNAEREALLSNNSALAGVELAYLLKDICLNGWSSDPAQAISAASAIQALADRTNNAEITALSCWAQGLEALIHGQMERAITNLDESQARFLALDKPHTAAATQVSKLIALSMLGRYEEAIQCGLHARDVLLEHNDVQAVGKIETNIGNLYFRRDHYREAEQFQTAARNRFKALNDLKHLAMVNNCLANTHALLHNFQLAEQLYEEAVTEAEESGSPVTLAGIEGNIGIFALLQGRYDRALDYLERSRGRYASMGMEPQSAAAQNDIADAYLELNLVPEALQIYRRVIPKFEQLGMQAEEARAAAYCGRALVQLNEIAEAQTYLAKAHKLFSAEQNEVGAAVVKLTQANLHYRQGNFALAGKMAAEAEASLETSGNWQRLLLARWLYGDIERATGNLEIARIILEQNLDQAVAKLQPVVAERCLTSLGLIAWQTGDVTSSEDYFRRAIDVIEDLRAPLPSEEFRTAFFADKLAPYREMVRLCLAGNRIDDALTFVERARSRTLAESFAGNLQLAVDSNDQFEADSLKQIETLRGELNYLYNQLSRSISGASLPGSSETGELQRALRDREDKLLEIARQLDQRGGRLIGQTESFCVKGLQARLRNRTALVEYTTVDDELLAFVVTNERVEVVRNLGVESDVASEIAQFRFQIDSLRYSSSSIRRHLPLLTERVRKHLTSLYDLLLRPLEPIIAGRQLAIVPHRTLHYLPFQALYDGSRYVVESREVSYAPSAAILQQCIERPPANFDTALLFGVADEQIPRVRDEIEAISTSFTRASSFLNEAATSEILCEEASAVDVVHLACHAQFRSDNPLFSSLQLGNGWLTVRDATQLKLNCGLVTLSACETGVSAIAPGDELIGLARGFFTAGSPSVLLSLWTVDDQATAELMVEFYNHLKAGEMPAAALRSAQVKIFKQMPHPFFWAAFGLVGRW